MCLQSVSEEHYAHLTIWPIATCLAQHILYALQLHTYTHASG